MIAVGLGFQNHASPQDIVAAVDEALSMAKLQRHDIAVFATGRIKQGMCTIVEAASEFSVDVRFVESEELIASQDRTLTHSPRSFARTGVGSLSEAAALAAAGTRSKLLSARLARGPVTCALARETEQ